ncbi:MAG: plasmid pRiA4b ORF-3 family protein [Bacteroidales bacterium]|nr:plasmid pRiA4b ORF-3 family protein [Bacteroidales bacterium]MCF8391132.1 plasmid pRiA4b ORF-3 family protein [Bacteroidales bacterium]
MILELKIDLINTNPKIWRRIQLNSDTSLNELHHIIQISMGWTNSHLYSFKIDEIEYSLPEYNYDFISYGDSRSYKIMDFADESFEYLYDFGDYWEHTIQIVRKIEGQKLINPVCLDGQATCPPEDVGGIHGFKEFKEIMKDKTHPERDSYIEWYGSVFNPDKINLEVINRNLANLKNYIREIEKG